MSVIPTSLIDSAVERAHQGGHPGESNLKHPIRTDFWFPNLDKAIRTKVVSCKPCHLYTNKTTKEPQSMLKGPSGAWDTSCTRPFRSTSNGETCSCCARHPYKISSCKNHTKHKFI